MPTNFSGGCACGAIRYECNAESITMFNCHCRDCQRASGSAFSAVVYVPAKAVKITKGSPRYYQTSSQSDPSLFKPQMHIWTSDAQSWNQMDPKLPKFEKYQE